MHNYLKRALAWLESSEDLDIEQIEQTLETLSRKLATPDADPKRVEDLREAVDFLNEACGRRASHSPCHPDTAPLSLPSSRRNAEPDLSPLTPLVVETQTLSGQEKVASIETLLNQGVVAKGMPRSRRH